MWVIQTFLGTICIACIIAFAIYGIWRITHPGQKW